MRKHLRLMVAALLTAVVVVASAGGAAQALGLHLVSQNSTTFVLGWTPQPGYGYLFSFDGAVVSRTNDASRDNVRFAKGHTGYDVAVIVKGETATCDFAPCVTTPPPGDTTPPSAPPNLRATASGQTTVTIAWNASTDNVAVAGYRVFRGASQVQSGTTLSFADQGLTCGSNYSYGVEAFDAAGNTSTRSMLATGTVPCSQPSANLFMSPSGSDSAACSSAAPCRTLDRAYRVAKPGDMVQIAAGSYQAAFIGNDSSKTSETDVVFVAAPGASITFNDQLVVQASHVTVDGSAAAGGKIRFLHGYKVESGSTLTRDVTLKDLDARGEQSQVYSSDRVLVHDVTVGGFCFAGAPGADALNIGEGSLGVPTNVTIEDSTIGDICYFPPEHPDCVAVFGADGLVFRRNLVQWCGTQGFYTKSDFGGKINNLLVENNWFGDLTRPGQSDAYYSLWIDDGTNVVVRYNSFATGVDGTFNVAAAGPVTLYGNAGQSGGCPGGVTYAYNVWTRDKCGPTDIVADPMFVNPTGGTGIDLRLKPGSPAIGRGDPTRFPADDYDGHPRSAPPDAGASQH